MNRYISLLGRIMIATIYLMSAVGNKIPNFNGVASYMASEGVPMPSLMLIGGIAFLIAGSPFRNHGIQSEDRRWIATGLSNFGDLLFP